MAEEKFTAVHYSSSPYNSLKFYADFPGGSELLECTNGTFVAETKEVHEAVEAARKRNVMLRSQLRLVDRAQAEAIAEEAKRMMISRNQAQKGPFQSVHAVSSEQRTADIMKEASANNAQDSAAKVAAQLTGNK